MENDYGRDWSASLFAFASMLEVDVEESVITEDEAKIRANAAGQFVAYMHALGISLNMPGYLYNGLN